jgi:hypothetical protein
METKHQNHRNTIREVNPPLVQNFVCELISTPLAAKLILLQMSEIILIWEWNNQCFWIRIISLFFNIELIDCPQVLMFLQLYEAIRILEFLSLFSNNGFCLFVVDCALLKKECDSYSETFCVGSQTKFQQHQNDRFDNQQSTVVNDMRHKVESMQLMG